MHLQQAAEWRGLVRANFTLGERPDRLSRAVLAGLPFGRTALGAIAAARARYPSAVAIVSTDDTLSYDALWRTAGALARGLQARGVNQESRIGLLCRNNAAFVRGLLAGCMLGSDIVLLNTAMAPPQLADIVADEDLTIVLHDDDFAPVFSERVDLSLSASEAMLLTVTHKREAPGRPGRSSRFVVLTSGTTGRPKGAVRSSEGGAASVGGLLQRVPLRVRDTIVLPAPFFHAWGLGMLLISLSLSCTVVARPEFDAGRTRHDLLAHDAHVLVAVPAMLQRMCELPPIGRGREGGRRLRIIASGGSALPRKVVPLVLDRYGPVLHNVYGSTEVSAATVASPADLQDDPGCAGRPVPGVGVAVVDDRGEPVPTGVAGRILVGNGAAFLGYTNAVERENRRQHLATGDLGHFDARGRLFVDGRADDMIVSGGENVYPVEVEDLLSLHEDVVEAVVVGVPDDRFGQALKAHVVLKPGRPGDPAVLQAYVRDRLARYKVPREGVFVDDFPRTATGKVIRRQLS